MEFVKIDKTVTGYLLNPMAYLDQLDLWRESPPLPDGAWRFASDPEHYDFRSERCVKDLKLLSLSSKNDELEVRYKFPGEVSEMLSLRYFGVRNLSVEIDPDATSSGMPMYLHSIGPVQLDEIRPHETGCIHEVRLIGATMMIECQDLLASWESC